MARWLDWPQAWVVAALVIAWLGGRILPWQPFGIFGTGLGVLLILGGIALMVLAVVEMRKAGTTVNPRARAGSLVTTGPFAYSRNPIYLGDLVLFAGVCLAFAAVWALPLTVVLGWILQERFITPEEAGLRRDFGTEFAEWSAGVGRWLGPI